MGGQQPDVKDLRQGEHGELLMTGELGHLLLPSLSVEALQPPSADTAAEASGQRELQRELQPFTKVIFSVQLNSDAYNQGLGIVLEQPPSMQCEMDRNGIPTYIYNGWGLSKDKNSNAIKFHPGMERGAAQGNWILKTGATSDHISIAWFSQLRHGLYTTELDAEQFLPYFPGDHWDRWQESVEGHWDQRRGL
eukprot:g2882.t1